MKQLSKSFYFSILFLLVSLICPLSSGSLTVLADTPVQDLQTDAPKIVYKRTNSGTWVYKGSAVYFKDRKNKYVKKTWKVINKKTYYFTSSGKMKTGWFQYKKQTYYLNTDGHMQKGWLQLGKYKYYFSKNGIMKTGFVRIGKKTYYFQPKNGRMKCGWAKMKGHKYYFNKNGVMVTGWLKMKDGKQYYFNGNGIMQTGQCLIKNKGYVFRQDGSLDKTAVYTGIDPNKKMVALTFDDGPGRYTMSLLNALEKYHAKATFFMVGQNVSSYAGTVKKMYQIGCELGNHSYSHARLTNLSFGQIQTEMSRTNSAIRSASGHSATVMRPPYGSYNSTVLSAAGLPAVYWSIDPRDWATLNTASTVNHVKQNVRDGSIILIHDIYSPSVQAAIQLIPWLQQQGYQLVTVSEMGKYRKGGLKSGSIYYNMYR